MSKLHSLISCRVSSTRQVNDGHGLESQEQRCKKYSQERGYFYEKTFLDEGVSGAIFDRPAIKEILQHIKNNPAKKYVVIFDDLNRIARDIKVHWAIKEAFASVMARVESPNFKFENTPEGKFIETILAGKSQLDREQNARQVKQKMKARLECGVYCFAAPAGMEYKKTPEHGKLLHLKQPEASVIKTALEGFASDRFLTQTDVLNFCLENKEKISGKRINFNFTKRILSEILYTGYIEFPNWKVKRLKGFHQSLITLKLYEKIQGKLKKPERKITARDKVEFPLRRLVNCSKCGKKMTGSNVKGKLRYYAMYTCNNKNCSASPKNIQKRLLEDEYISLLNKITPESEIIELTRAISLDVWKKSSEEIKRSDKAIGRELKSKEKEIGTYVDLSAKTSSDIVRKKYELRIEDLEKEALVFKKQPLAADYLNCEDAISEVLHFLGTPADYWQKANLEGKFMVHNLLFRENPTFDLQNGFGTPEVSLPFAIKDAIYNDVSSMVDPRGFELLTSSVQMRRSTN